MLPSQLRQAFYDVQRDTTVLLSATGQAFDVVSIADSEASFYWKSKPFEVPPTSFTTARVLATKYPVIMDVVSDGRDGPVQNSYVLQDERPVRLAPGYGSRWQIALAGEGRVTDATICQSPLELK